MKQTTFNRAKHIFVLSSSRINYGQITTTQTMLPLVEQLRSLCFNRVKSLQVSSWLVCLFFKFVSRSRNYVMISDSFSISTVNYFFVIKDSVGFNLAAVKFMKQQLDESEQVRLFSDLTIKHKEKSKKSNRVTLVSLKSASSVLS